MLVRARGMDRKKGWKIQKEDNDAAICDRFDCLGYNCFRNCDGGGKRASSYSLFTGKVCIDDCSGSRFVSVMRTVVPGT